MPAFMPPRMSDDSLSPTMTALSRSKPSMRENTISKNFFVGLSAPSRSDMKISLKYGAMPALSRRLSCTEAVPFETM